MSLLTFSNLNSSAKKTCSTISAWIQVGLLQSKSEMIKLPENVYVIIIHGNPISCCLKHHQQRYHNENTKICIFIYYMYVDILFTLIKAIPIMFECITTYFQTLKTWIGHNATHYDQFYALTLMLPNIDVSVSLTWIGHNMTCLS